MESPRPIRLADLLDEAAIQSPLTDVTPATELEQLGEVPRETVFEENFDASPPGWPARGFGSVEEAGGRSALHLSNTQRGAGYGWYVPAKPNSHYIFERWVRTGTELQADFAVVESTVMGRTAPVGHRAAEYNPGKSTALKAHWPEPPQSDGSWQRGSVSFFTTSKTKALAIFVRPTARRQTQLFRFGDPKTPQEGQEIWFDGIRLEHVRPTPGQTMALLKAQALAAGEKPDRGIHKRGQFPPIGVMTAGHSRQDDNFSYRYALYAPTPTDLGFAVPVENNATLYFSACLSRQTRRGDAARFEVLVRSGGREESVWSRKLTAARNEWWWHEARVDLKRFAGQTVEVVLRTRAETGNPHPMWGNPVIDTPPTTDTVRNVILIAVDTLRADRLSCYGYAKPTSPHLDALAEEGVRFEHVVSNANWTCPSFASILTGVVPARHGVFGLGPVTPLPDGLFTVAERFRAAGWATQAIVYKSALYDGGYEQGFDVAFNVPRGRVDAQQNLDEAMEWLEANSDRRNFLFLHFNDPHLPFTQPKPFDRKFGDHPDDHGLPMRPVKTSTNEVYRDVWRGLYDGEVAYVDDRIGAFFAALKERGMYDDAAIVFVSDHGEELWEREQYGHGQDRLHDEVVRVPLIVKPPRKMARGKVVQTQVAAFDVMPTILEFAGLEVGPDLDAKSLVPLLDPEAPDAADRVSVIETNRGSLALRNRDWKYILRNRRARRREVATPRVIVEELYELGPDPGEKVDVAGEHPDVLERLRLQLLDYLLRSKPGHFMVVLGGATAEEYDLLVGGVSSAVTLFGIPTGAANETGSVSFRAEWSDPLVLVADLELTGPVVLGEEARPAPEFRRYQAGELARLLEAGDRGIHMFEGPPRIAPATGSMRTLDARQLQALRELGYTGAGGQGR